MPPSKMAGLRCSLKVACLLVCLSFVLLESEAWIFSSSGSSSSGSSGPYSYDIRTQSGLTRLYNQRVTYATKMERRLGSGTPMVGPIRHSGVVVNTADGGRWLVHKGDDYGRSSQTVVTDARHMSSGWRTVYGKAISHSTVADYVRAGGSSYSLLTDNCHHAANRMMQLN